MLTKDLLIILLLIRLSDFDCFDQPVGGVDTRKNNRQKVKPYELKRVVEWQGKNHNKPMVRQEPR
jgi:hypothetical protein